MAKAQKRRVAEGGHGHQGEATEKREDPIDRIQWVKAESLTANHYNPNVVHVQELTLLERSILVTGWIQPILVSEARIIIDGFHRWTLAKKSTALQKRYRGEVPIVVLPLDEAEAMMMTIRINRAKGTHVAIRMSEIVHSLVRDHGIDRQAVAANIGANLDEVDLLLQDGIFKARNLDKMPYSNAWVPRPAAKT